MKDLYRRLGISESATDAEVRAALRAADADTLQAAVFILLDPRRRAVYDRNRRTVATIGRLRANLGLNLTRFWPRSRFEDFTIELTAPPPRRRPVVMDRTAVAWAFGVKPAARARPPRRRLVVALVVLAIIALAVAVVWVGNSIAHNALDGSLDSGLQNTAAGGKTPPTST